MLRDQWQNGGGMTELAKITPAQRVVRADVPPPPAPRDLSPREKAAVIVRLLLSEGSAPPIADLPEHMQASLTEQMSRMRLIDRTTLAAVVDEFMAELEQVGLSFPGGIEGALSIMDGHISTTAANRLRRLAGASGRIDPWDRLITLPAERLLPAAEAESPEVTAVLLSKLPVARAAEILGRLPGDKARRVAFAVSMTGDVDPETVHRIGRSILSQIDAQPPRAFDTAPVKRVGAILNVAASQTRDDVLRGLEADDAEFADQVRRSIFTFAHIPARLAARDVPRVLRMVEQAELVTALAAATTPETQATADFLLANISQRLAQGLRDEAAARARPREKDADAAMNAIVGVIRDLAETGELVLVEDEEEAED